MELNINGKNYELSFGIKFIREMDKIHEQDLKGIKMGIGLEMMEAQLSMGRPTALFDVIKCATSHLKSKPSNDDIEAFLEEKAINGELESLFEEVGEATKQAPFLKQALEQNQDK